MTAEHRPDPITPEPAIEAAVGAGTPDRPIADPMTPDPSPLTPDVVPVMPVVHAPSVAAPTASRRRRLALGALRAARPLMSVGLLVIGIALGATLYGMVQPKEPSIVADSPGTVPPPAAVQEFIAALAANNSDAVRAAVQPDPYRLLAGELSARSYQAITSVDTLGTVMDGDRSATEIIIHGSGSGGQNVVVNLVVHATKGVIVNFR